MNFYTAYLNDIEKRKEQGLNPKPIDDGSLVKELISQIKDSKSKYRKDSLHFFVYNILPGTTSAATEKSKFLKQIILGENTIEEISKSFALELLSHMKGGSSIGVLLDLALGADMLIAQNASEILKTQFFFFMMKTQNVLKVLTKKGMQSLKAF